MLGVARPRRCSIEPRRRRCPTGAPVIAAAARPSDLAVALFTGGSTGEPKAVLHTHRGLAHKALTMVRVHGLRRRDAVLMPAPLAHVSGLLNGILVPGAAGMRTVLMARWDPERGAAAHRDGARSASWSDRRRSSCSSWPRRRSRPSGSRRCDWCRAAAPGSRRRSWSRRPSALGARVKRSYGSTEAPTITSSTARDSARPRGRDRRSPGRASASSGSARTASCSCAAPSCSPGTPTRRRPARRSPAGWFATGDLATIDDRGWLTIVGRKKDVIIRGGENIAAAEVEDVLVAHPTIREAVAVGYPDEQLGERVCAFVVSDGPFDLEQCRAWFAERGVARFKTPERVRAGRRAPGARRGQGRPRRPTPACRRGFCAARSLLRCDTEIGEGFDG